MIGWYAHIRYTSTGSSTTFSSLEGCVEVRGTLWKGTAEVRSGEINGISVSNEPLCIECQSPMNRDETKVSGISSARSRNSAAMGGGGRSKTQYRWKCPSSGCGNTVVRDFDREDEAFNLFSKHFDRIVKSQGENYSLNSLINKIDDTESEVTSRHVWRKYVEIANDPDVSKKCF
ncbi:hypothetical protein GCM10028858_21220 [Halorubrum pallidum]